PTLRAAHAPAPEDSLGDYAQRVRDDTRDPDAGLARMQAANPIYVLLHYLALHLNDSATDVDASAVAELGEGTGLPSDKQPLLEAFAARRPDWARDRAGCSMLSCSS